MWSRYRRTNVAEMRPVNEDDIQDGLGLSSGVSVAEVDRDNGSPRIGDMIARNPKNHEDQWLVAEKYFSENFEKIPNLKKNNL